MGNIRFSMAAGLLAASLLANGILAGTVAVWVWRHGDVLMRVQRHPRFGGCRDLRLRYVDGTCAFFVGVDGSPVRSLFHSDWDGLGMFFSREDPAGRAHGACSTNVRYVLECDNVRVSWEHEASGRCRDVRMRYNGSFRVDDDAGDGSWFAPDGKAASLNARKMNVRKIPERETPCGKTASP